MIEFDTFEPDSDRWVPLPGADGDIPGRRRTWEGRPGTDWEGAVMTLEILPNE